MRTTKLKRMHACGEAILYVKSQKSIISGWQNCQRGDWMLWLARKLHVDDKKLTMAKAMCAKQVEHLMKDQRSKDALQACFDYVNGKITRQELDAYAANAYAATYAATYAAAYAAYAATYAANAYAANAYAAAYAANAYAATYAAAKADSLRKSADICREYLTEEVLNSYKRLR